MWFICFSIGGEILCLYNPGNKVYLEYIKFNASVSSTVYILSYYIIENVGIRIYLSVLSIICIYAFLHMALVSYYTRISIQRKISMEQINNVHHESNIYIYISNYYGLVNAYNNLSFQELTVYIKNRNQKSVWKKKN